MLFHSLEFMIFLPLVVALFFAVPHKWRWLLLLVASYVFYGSWRWKHLLLILMSTGVDYVAALNIYQTDNSLRKKLFLYLSLGVNLGILFLFKYANFFIEEASGLLAWMGVDYMVPSVHLLLPVGISFYTFQTMSYTLDVYFGRISPEKHLGRFALFVAFFPQLVAGPIERAGSILPQLRKEAQFSYVRITSGLKRMAWGFFKKLVIADRLATFVDPVFDDPSGASGLAIVMATLLFAFQIYCDFSAYSDIAIGIARILGIDLMENFRQPYFARSVGEFWQRWHISLSTWFKDYVYIPLGGNRVVKWRWYYNLMVVFLVSGLWHGANWTFVVWGALHGIFLIGERVLRKDLSGLKNLTGLVPTFLLVCFAWLFFRANSIEDVGVMLTHIADFQSGWASLEVFAFNLPGLALSFVLIAFLSLADLWEETGKREAIWAKWPRVLQWAVYIIGVWLILNLGIFGEREFIYFQF